MYHQFMRLADIDITKEPMEVGPTTHYMMGGVRVDADTQMSTLPGLFAAGECAAGLHGANRLGGNSLSDLLVFGKRAGAFAAQFATEQAGAQIDDDQVEDTLRKALESFESHEQSGGDSYASYGVHHDLQDLMQDLVGIVRSESELVGALEGIGRLRERAQRVRVDGNRQYNPGWHTALALRNLLTVSEAVARTALERRESRGAHFRQDYPDKDPTLGKVNIVVKKGADGDMRISRRPIPEIRPDLQHIITEMK